MTKNAKKGIKPPKDQAQEGFAARSAEPRLPAPGTPLQNVIDESNARERRARGGSRLPPAGAVLKKVDRDGKVRCECAAEVGPHAQVLAALGARRDLRAQRSADRRDGARATLRRRGSDRASEPD